MAIFNEANYSDMVAACDEEVATDKDSDNDTRSWWNGCSCSWTGLSVDEMDAVVVEPEHKNVREVGIDVDKKNSDEDKKVDLKNQCI